MGWERRGPAGRAYYYRSRRMSDGRVVKDYCGHGGRAYAAAAEVARRTAARRADRLAVERAVVALATLDRLTEAFSDGVRLLTEALLLANGYRRTNFGPWRKQRGHGRDEAAAGAGAGA